MIDIEANAKRKKRGTSGFTLVEVVVASAIVGISMAGVWGLIAWIMYTTSLTGRQSEALYIAEEKMEEIFAAAGSSSSGHSTSNDYSCTWTITAIDSRQTDVEVAVTWYDPRGRTNRVELNSSLITAVTSFTGVAFGDLFSGGS